MAKEIKNPAASVRARLLKLAKANGQSFELVLTRFALERLLYRLGRSAHADRFVLKGAMLMMSWFDDPHRATRDLDLLGFGDPSPEALVETFRAVLAQEPGEKPGEAPGADGLVFDPAAIRVDRIRDENEYGGVRLRADASLAGARIKLTVDIGFGDSLEPGLEEIDYPALLDLPPPRLRAYARETVIAEKFQAMVALGRVNSRMKDFYDIWVLSRAFPFDEDRLACAIAATFARRGTPIPAEPPDALTRAFAEDAEKRRQWRLFVEDVALDPGDLAAVIDDLAAFLMPHAARAAARRTDG